MPSLAVAAATIVKKNIRVVSLKMLRDEYLMNLEEQSMEYWLLCLCDLYKCTQLYPGNNWWTMSDIAKEMTIHKFLFCTHTLLRRHFTRYNPRLMKKLQKQWTKMVSGSNFFKLNSHQFCHSFRVPQVCFGYTFHKSHARDRECMDFYKFVKNDKNFCLVCHQSKYDVHRHQHIQPRLESFKRTKFQRDVTMYDTYPIYKVLKRYKKKTKMILVIKENEAYIIKSKKIPDTYNWSIYNYKKIFRDYNTRESFNAREGVWITSPNKLYLTWIYKEEKFTLFTEKLNLHLNFLEQAYIYPYMYMPRNTFTHEISI